MFLSQSEYDHGVNTFSPEGRLFQVEYAIEAIKLGSTAIGIKTDEGVVLVVEKRIASSLLEPTSVQKVVEIDRHIGLASSGLTADARTLTDHARVEAQNHWFSFNETMPTKSLAESVGDLAINFADEDAEERIMSRPFGVALLFAGVDGGKTSLFHMDPSGTVIEWDAKVIGQASESAQSQLEERYFKGMSFAEAEELALSVLKEVMEEKVTNINIDIGSVRVDSGKFHLYSPDEVAEVLSRIE
ncbi:hypothetical protein P9112_005189 [Eukaryota sp. TZLM1-RC]